MMNSVKFFQNYPLNYPIKMDGKLTYKVVIKDDYKRQDGTCALFVQMFLNSERKRIPLNIAVKPENFDKKKQRISTKHPMYKDLNLLIEKKLSDINVIEVNYRLSGVTLNMDKLIYELDNPTSFIDFIKFWEEELTRQKDIIKPGTHRQQTSALNKLKEFKDRLYFYEINPELFQEILIYLKVKRKNNKSTVSTFAKNFKKYLHIAEKRGIRTNLSHEDITVTNFRGERTFLDYKEINSLFEYWSSKWINDTHKSILSKFLFSCFTGLRISDVMKLDSESIIGDYIVFVAQKTDKVQRVVLNDSAKKFISDDSFFKGEFTGEYINRTLKDICKIVKITKKVSFHVARHTFATNFLIAGGRVEVLQKILGHSKIDETMIYVHIVESIKNDQIFNMDEILSEKPLD